MNLWDIYFTMELFFAAIIFGLVVSLILSYFFSFFSLKQGYELELEWAKKVKNENAQNKYKYFINKIALPFWGYFIVIILFSGVLLYSFSVFADTTNQIKNTATIEENASCSCPNATIINNYNLTVNQITADNQHRELSIKELKYFMNTKSRTLNLFLENSSKIKMRDWLNE